MANTALDAELQRLQLMIAAVRKVLRPEDVEAAIVLRDIAERLVTLTEVAEASSEVEEEAIEAKLSALADQTDPE